MDDDDEDDVVYSEGNAQIYLASEGTLVAPFTPGTDMNPG